MNCNCQDTPTIRRDGRPIEVKALMDLCPRHKMDRCLCHDNKIVKFPFDMTTVFFDCRPKKVSSKATFSNMGKFESGLFFQCKCVGDDKPKKVTGIGCKNGGYPWCPYTNKRQTDSVCRDGTPMYMNDVLTYRMPQYNSTGIMNAV